MNKALIIAALIPLLAGCTKEINYVMTEYGKTDVIDYIEPASQEKFRIFYNAGSSKMMITPGMGRLVQKGVTFGAAQLPPEQVYANVATSWLKSQGRICSPTNTVLVIENQYEVSFQCKS